MTVALRVLVPGLMTTLQDLGRPGFQHLEVTGAAFVVADARELGRALQGRHLVLQGRTPLDQGLLTSCYVMPSRALSAEEVHELFADAYRDEPFIE